MNVFISVPMRDLTDQQIDDELELVAKIAHAYFPLGHLEFVSNFGVEPEDIDENVKHESVWHLGEALKCLSTCDAIMCPENTLVYNGCAVEKETARWYGIPIYEYDEKVLDEFLRGEFHDEYDTEDRAE